MNSLACDVLIVGGGGAGLAAAIEAALAGAKVILLEKNSALGGSTGMSVGSITAAGTPEQRRKGIHDDFLAHAADLKTLNDRVRPETNPTFRMLLAENAPKTLEWLKSLGIEFVGPFPELPHQRSRMHNVVPSSRAYIDRLRRRALEVGVTIRCHVAAQSLVLESGRVAGVVAHRAAVGDLRVASRATVLATGDFSSSPELLARYVSEQAARLPGINPTSTGDGHAMAVGIGAAMCRQANIYSSLRFVSGKRMKLINGLPTAPLFAKILRLGFENLPAWIVRPILMTFLTSILQPEPRLYYAGAILINRRGQRFGDETQPLVYELPKQPDGSAYIIFDSRIAKRFSKWPDFLSTAPGIGYAYVPDFRRYRPDLCHEARGLPDLAAAIGVDPIALAESVRAYNRAVSSFNRLAVEEPPFFALGPVKSYITLTDGGLMVDSGLRVLRPDANPIPGLYAAGAVGQGDLLLRGHGHHLGWAFTSGRLAGKNAAAFAAYGH
jgi:succinate dehydrogenase/fumarate reductase flavoprotein subunit